MFPHNRVKNLGTGYCEYTIPPCLPTRLSHSSTVQYSTVVVVVVVVDAFAFAAVVVVVVSLVLVLVVLVLVLLLLFE